MMILVWSVALLCIYVTSGSNKMPCKFNSECRCGVDSITKLYMADCSNLKMETIPLFPANIQIINMINNDLKLIPDGHFIHNGLLKELYVSQNKITFLTKDTFQGLSNVTKLVLNTNEIHNTTRDVFFYLNQLQYLDIKNTSINISLVDFSFLPSLKSLLMDLIGNGSVVFPRGLVSLTQADWSGLTGKCNVTILTPESFQFLPTLEEINLSACKINRIYKGTFSFMKNLTILDISNNTCLKFNGAANVSSDMPGTSIKILKLNKIHKTFELNTKLLVSHISYLNETNLTEIQIDSNRIQLAERGVVTLFPPTLRKISMRDNEFSYGEYLLEIFASPVEYLDISDRFKSHTDFVDKENCQFDNRNNCEDNAHMHKTDDLLSTRNWKNVPFPRFLKSFIYRKSNVNYLIPQLELSGNTVEYLDGSYNHLNPWIGPIMWLNSAKYLDLSNNLCSNVSTVFFKSVPNLRHLLIQNNLLGFVLPYDVDGQILQYLTKVEDLNLSENRIPFLPEKFFKNQINLKRLYLGGNMLNDITFEIVHMKHLIYLDLSRNRITSLTQRAQNQLNSVFHSSKTLTIDLSGNMLTCTCDTESFVSWLANTPINVRNLYAYKCTSNSETKGSMQNVTQIYQNLTKECYSYTGLIIGTTVTILLFLFILVTGLVYRNRWKLRYMFYMVKIQYQKKGKTLENVDKLIYKYDVFVSYEQNDNQFVHNKVLPILENDAGLKLCLHQRDFLPGKEIAENITGAIHSSRKMLVIMSHKYLDSKWCMFEFNMAKIESLYSQEKENIMFLVFLEQMQTKQLPLVVLELVQSQSYIEYPNDEYGDSVFWNKLKEVLQ